MNRGVYLTSGVLAALALVLMGYKVFGLGYSFVPRKTTGLWTVELQVNLRGNDRQAKVEAYLPPFMQNQAIQNEKSTSGGMRLFIRESGEQKQNRLAVWSGRVNDTLRVSHTVTVRITGHKFAIPARMVEEKLPDILQPWVRPSPTVPSGAKKIKEAVGELTKPADDPVARLRKIYRFVAVEVDDTESRRDSDALLTLERKQGNPEGKARLFAALARAAGIPARVLGGLRLKEGTTDKFHAWNEVFLDGWIPVDTSQDLLGVRTPDMLVLRRGGLADVSVTGARASSYEYRMVRELQTVVEQTRAAQTGEKSWVNRYSLLNVPLREQLVFKILLLVPIGCLIISVLRNIVGINTFGTFMPVLLALAFLQTSLGWGILFLLIVVGFSVGARRVLDDMHLLRVPRLGIIVSFVVLILMVLTILGGTQGVERALSVGFFPIIVMAMMVERLVVTLEESGARTTSIICINTAIAAAVSYAVIYSESLQAVFLLFPELTLIVIALMILIGRYTGYRLMEYFRFKVFHSGP